MTEKETAMKVEIRERGVEAGHKSMSLIGSAFMAALDRFNEQVRRIRIRLVKIGHGNLVHVRARAWFLSGPSLVASADGKNIESAVYATAEKLERALRRKKGRRIALRHRPVDG